MCAAATRAALPGRRQMRSRRGAPAVEFVEIDAPQHRLPLPLCCARSPGARRCRRCASCVVAAALLSPLLLSWFCSRKMPKGGWEHARWGTAGCHAMLKTGCKAGVAPSLHEGVAPSCWLHPTPAAHPPLPHPCRACACWPACPACLPLLLHRCRHRLKGRPVAGSGLQERGGTHAEQ